MSTILDHEQTQHIFLTLVESLERGERLPTKILVRYLRHPEPAIRKLAVELIEFGNDPAAIPALLRAAADSNIEVGLSASEVLRSFHNPAAVDIWLKAQAIPLAKAVSRPSWHCGNAALRRRWTVSCERLTMPRLRCGGNL